MQEKKLSVIMPVYNVVNYVNKAVLSVLSQGYKNIELLLVDDGSTDGSREICQNLSKSDSRIKLICKQNQGVSSARNDALALATGDYVTFVDSDDWLELDAYEKMMAYLLETNADIAVMGFTPEGNDNFVAPLEIENQKILSRDEAMESLISCRIYTWSLWDKIYKRSLIKDIYFSTDIFNGEDLLFNWQVFKRAEKVSYIPLHGYHYIQRSDSMVNTFSVKKLTVINAFERVLEDCNRKDDIGRKIQEKYISTIINLGLNYFGSSYAKCIGFKYIEIEKVQRILRSEWQSILFSKYQPKIKVAAFLLMLPVPIVVIIIKLYYMIKRRKVTVFV